MLKRTLATLLAGLAAIALFSVSGCGKPETAPEAPKPQRVYTEPQGGMTQFFTKNVIYRVDEDIVCEMPNFVADIRVFEPNQPFIPANIDDFVVQVHTANLTIDEKSMAALFNKYVFNYPGSPLFDVQIKVLDGKLRQTAKLKKFGLTLTCELEGQIKANGKGQLVLHPTSIKSNGIPVKGLFDLIGLEVASLINANEDKGVKIEGNNVILFPDRMIPPPTLRGFCTGATLTPGKITMTFDDGVKRPEPDYPDKEAKNYILMWGGNVLINNNLVLNTKMQMIDDTPDDPMHYYMPVYREQLQAGTTVATTKGEMLAYLSDVHGTKVERGRYRPQFPLR